MTAGSLCAACGLPGHRYGRNEGIERFCPQACINQLRGILEEGRKVEWCETHRSRQWGDSQICEALAGALQPASPCRMVAATLIVEDTP